MSNLKTTTLKGIRDPHFLAVNDQVISDTFCIGANAKI